MRGEHPKISETTFRTYDSALGLIGSWDLLEPCFASVLVSGHRFVCGPSYDWERVFYTYDTLTGQLVASSDAYTYKGIPMKRIPGTDDFITVTTDQSPPDYNLYSVMPNGVATHINRQGTPSITALPIFAIDGTPPVHLISQWGGLATIYGPDCLSKPEARTSTCFLKDRSLNALTGSQQFDGMDSDAMGNLFGLVDMIDPITDPPCSHGCVLETIKVATDTVVSQRVLHLTAKEIVAFRHDPIAGAALIGYTHAQTSDGGQQTLYHVVSVPY